MSNLAMRNSFQNGKADEGEICLELKEMFEKFLLLSKPINL